MGKMSDNYPPGMDECSRNGLFGHCGIECEKLLRGECENASNYEGYTSLQGDGILTIIIRESGKILELEQRTSPIHDKWWVIREDGCYIRDYEEKEEAEEVFHDMVLIELESTGLLEKSIQF